MLNVFFIFSQAKNDEGDFNKYASKSVQEQQRMYEKFDVHTVQKQKFKFLSFETW